MKKIALLFTILCAGQLYGMENPERGRHIGLEDLSPEIQVMIIHALNTYDNLDDVINSIKASSLTNQQLNAVVNDMYGNLPGFKKLAHTLANKFNTSVVEIAQKFNTPASRQYINLIVQLIRAIENRQIDMVTQLIKQGADINLLMIDNMGYYITPLLYAALRPSGLTAKDVAIVQLLINSGANPNIKTHLGNTVLDEIKQSLERYIQLHPALASGSREEDLVNNMKKVAQILEDAMKK